MTSLMTTALAFKFLSGITSSNEKVITTLDWKFLLRYPNSGIFFTPSYFFGVFTSLCEGLLQSLGSLRLFSRAVTRGGDPFSLHLYRLVSNYSRVNYLSGTDLRPYCQSLPWLSSWSCQYLAFLTSFTNRLSCPFLIHISISLFRLLQSSVVVLISFVTLGLLLEMLSKDSLTLCEGIYFFLGFQQWHEILLPWRVCPCKSRTTQPVQDAFSARPMFILLAFSFFQLPGFFSLLSIGLISPGKLFVYSRRLTMVWGGLEIKSLYNFSSLSPLQKNIYQKVF